jgi:hypothetical protein
MAFGVVVKKVRFWFYARNILLNKNSILNGVSGTFACSMLIKKIVLDQVCTKIVLP